MKSSSCYHVIYIQTLAKGPGGTFPPQTVQYDKKYQMQPDFPERMWRNRRICSDTVASKHMLVRMFRDAKHTRVGFLLKTIESIRISPPKLPTSYIAVSVCEFCPALQNGRCVAANFRPPQEERTHSIKHPAKPGTVSQNMRSSSMLLATRSSQLHNLVEPKQLHHVQGVHYAITNKSPCIRQASIEAICPGWP